MLKISQSLLKGLLQYSSGEGCGLVFKAKYIDSRFDLFPPSDAMNLGAWFEYVATGSVPKNGSIPIPKTLKVKAVKEVKPKKPKKLKKGEVALPELEAVPEEIVPKAEVEPELSADYRLMIKHLDNFKKVMEHYGLEIIKAGEDISVPYPDAMERFGVDVVLTGTLDIRIRATRDIFAKDSNGHKVKVLSMGETAIFDMKVSGLLDDVWNLLGWGLSRLHEKVSLITQPIHYKFIEVLKTGINPPFLFFLFNPKDENDCRLIDFRFDESQFDTHRAFIDKAIPHLLHYQKYGYQPRPSLAKCAECPLKEECKFRATIPPITVYYLQ